MRSDEPAQGVSRRTALKRLGAAGAAVWATPAILTMGRAGAQDGTPRPCTFRVELAPVEGSGSAPGPCAPVPIPSSGSGQADLELDLTAGTISWDISWEDLTTNVILGHIHRAPFPCNGGIVVDFTLSGGPTGSESDSAAIAQDLAEEICADPSGFYVNVHTDAFPGGEIRGQLA